MLHLILPALAAPVHAPPVHDCASAWAAARAQRVVTHCRASVIDGLGVRRAVTLTAQHLLRPGDTELGVHWWGPPDVAAQITRHGRSITQQTWAYDEGFRLTQSIPTEVGMLAVTVDVRSDDHDSAEALALTLADGTRFAHLDGPLTPFDTASTWVDLPTHDCNAAPGLVPTGALGVRCEATFQQGVPWRLVTYEVAQRFVPGRTVSVDDLAGPDAMSAVTVHQGHPAEDRLWTDAGGTHRVRVVERDGVYVTLTATVHAHGDDDARALAERIVDAVDLRVLR